jgi:hypothetical protein
MAIYNTGFDAANTAVRAFLTKVGEHYLGRTFNTAAGAGRQDWRHIKEEVFNNECAYCGTIKSSLQIEHLVMFNRTEYGLHHPGNVVPCCENCNRRSKREDGTHATWEEHLLNVCQREGATQEQFDFRRGRILKHINDSDYKYPDLSAEEKHAIRVIANSLYENVKIELGKSLELYKELDLAFVKANPQLKEG